MGVKIWLYEHGEEEELSQQSWKFLGQVQDIIDLCMTKEQMKKWEWNCNVHNLS
jgi:hypothetical protein